MDFCSKMELCARPGCPKHLNIYKIKYKQKLCEMNWREILKVHHEKIKSKLLHFRPEALKNSV